jgi:hypothetical protein
MKRSSEEISSNQEIQKQIKIVNAWKTKIEETQKLLAEYNTIAAKEGRQILD